MTNYNTELNTWGSTGSQPPIGYSYIKDEGPVDQWDNFVNFNLIKDIKHLVSLTNNRLDSSRGSSMPSSPTNGQLFWNSNDSTFRIYDSSFSGWRRLSYASDVYTKSESDNRYYTKSDSDNRYYTQSEIDSAFTTTDDLHDDFYTKSQANDRYHTKGNLYTRSESNDRYYTKIQADDRYYTKTQADNRYHTRTHIESNYYSSAQADNRYYTQDEIDSAFTTTSELNSEFYTKAQADNRYHTKSDLYTRSQSDDRYYTKDDSDDRYFTRSQANDRYHTKSVADNRFVRQHHGSLNTHTTINGAALETSWMSNMQGGEIAPDTAVPIGTFVLRGGERLMISYIHLTEDGLADAPQDVRVAIDEYDPYIHGAASNADRSFVPVNDTDGHMDNPISIDNMYSWEEDKVYVRLALYNENPAESNVGFASYVARVVESND